MQNNKNKNKTGGFRLFIKSVVWTLIAISLIAIGYFGAEFLLG